MANLLRAGSPVSLFLLGKTGHGKSSTGNTILGREEFHTSDGSESDTFECVCSWSRFQGQEIKVVDGPGVGETRLSQGEAAMKMLADMAEGLFFCPDGFDALIIVLRYGVRFTKEEKDAVMALKACFGENFVRDFGVILFTYGEQFEMLKKKKRGNVTFQQWLQEQTGDLQELLRECEGRHVLFHNLNEEKRDQNVSELLGIVEKLKRRGQRYIPALFEKIKEEHDKFYARQNATELKEKMQAKIDLLRGSIRDVNENEGSISSDDLTIKLDRILEDVADLKEEIEKEDRKSGVLEALMNIVKVMEKDVQNYRRTSQERAATEAEKQRLQDQLRDREKELAGQRAQGTPNTESSFFGAVVRSIGKVLVGAVEIVGGVIVSVTGFVNTGRTLFQSGFQRVKSAFGDEKD